ncbi:MAG: KEOPS complex N(6)-L-threonylcarbamoyladenine synthase Kae1 [Candidatus Hodarchaeota archaeon]
MKSDMKLCLGIESTAHTWSVGIVDFHGNILSLINNTFVPEEGGLHPALVREHHLSIFMNTIKKSLLQANLSIKDIDLIAFSRSPGLGPVLRIGALVARMLSQLIKIPIVGVNHCIAHIEIGRLLCKIDDPLSLYVSGGNTIISAFESGHYQIFGETQDIAVGNMIDMFARDAGLQHPGGPKIEKLASQSTNYLHLPYVVKGMDLSFSGLYTSARSLLNSEKFGQNYDLKDISYSLQETSFAMLTEVTERALAHTEKREVLLTGGVAANKRLQEMIKYISDEHKARFEVVPLKYAGDNGAMIAWTGILRYSSEGKQTIENSIIKPKERMDQIQISWRN